MSAVQSLYRYELYFAASPLGSAPSREIPSCISAFGELRRPLSILITGNDVWAVQYEALVALNVEGVAVPEDPVPASNPLCIGYVRRWASYIFALWKRGAPRPVLGAPYVQGTHG